MLLVWVCCGGWFDLGYLVLLLQIVVWVVCVFCGLLCGVRLSGFGFGSCYGWLICFGQLFCLLDVCLLFGYYLILRLWFESVFIIIWFKFG